MFFRPALVMVLVAFTSFTHARAQHQGQNGGHGAQHAAGVSPYAGIQERPIKALSEQQIADLRAGRGMGFALAAELNGYPGPLHVIELADSLRLTPEQRARLEALHRSMKGETAVLGKRLIQQEADLDRLFASRTVTSASLLAATSTIGATQVALRKVHLRFHLATIEVLTPEQVAHHNEARGYNR
jgi:Spy/CpxP family protein refolding chaperone